MSKKNAFYAQSGGVTAVINATACGVIETARKNKSKIGKVFAGRNGIIGALTEDLIDTDNLEPKVAIQKYAEIIHYIRKRVEYVLNNGYSFNNKAN